MATNELMFTFLEGCIKCLIDLPRKENIDMIMASAQLIYAFFIHENNFKQTLINAYRAWPYSMLNVHVKVLHNVPYNSGTIPQQHAYLSKFCEGEIYLRIFIRCGNERFG